MYKLHGFFTQNSMKPIYVLEELGVEWEFCFVDLAKGEHMTDRFPARPKGGTQMSQYCVTALKKDQAILCGLRLVLEYLGASEPAIITLKEC